MNITHLEHCLHITKCFGDDANLSMTQSSTQQQTSHQIGGKHDPNHQFSHDQLQKTQISSIRQPKSPLFNHANQKNSFPASNGYLYGLVTGNGKRNVPASSTNYNKQIDSIKPMDIMSMNRNHYNALVSSRPFF